MTQDLVDDAGQYEAISKIRDRVSNRLRRFCAEFSDPQFATLVRDVARNEFLSGFNGPEKESRLQLFAACYREVG